MIEIVGHFGTLFSYATVGGRVTEALHRAGLVARVSNIDSDWHPRWSHLSSISGTPTHCLLFTAPNQYMTVYPDIYGGGRSGIFVSPNTQQLDPEHGETIARFGLAVAPSAYCARTVANHLLHRQLAYATTRHGDSPVATQVTTCPIGSPVSISWGERRAAVARRIENLSMPNPTLLHFTTDQAWPGRKGTEELLQAWRVIQREWKSWPGATLVIHGPQSIERHILTELRYQDIDSSVQFVSAPHKGESDVALAKLLDAADVAVLPSRAEGFGMMILAALHAGVPLVTTCNTAHAEFLVRAAGSWLAVPTPFSSPIAFERGDVPDVDPQMLAATLRIALDPSVRRTMLDASRSSCDDADTLDAWSDALPQWIETIKEWMEAT